MMDAVSLASLGYMEAREGEVRPAQQTYSTSSRLVITVHHSLTRKEGEDG